MGVFNLHHVNNHSYNFKLNSLVRLDNLSRTLDYRSIVDLQTLGCLHEWKCTSAFGTLSFGKYREQISIIHNANGGTEEKKMKD